MSEAEGGASLSEKLSAIADTPDGGSFIFNLHDLLAAFRAGVETSDLMGIEAEYEFAFWFKERTRRDRWGKTAN